MGGRLMAPLLRGCWVLLVVCAAVHATSVAGDVSDTQHHGLTEGAVDSVHLSVPEVERATHDATERRMVDDQDKPGRRHLHDGELATMQVGEPIFHSIAGDGGGRKTQPEVQQEFQESSRLKFQSTPVKLALSDEDITKLNIHDKLLKHTLTGAIELSREMTEIRAINNVVATESEPNAATQHLDEGDAAQADDHPQEEMRLLRSIEESGALKPLASERFFYELPPHGKSTASGGDLVNSNELFADLFDSNRAVDICIADPSTLTVQEVTSNASFAKASGDGVDRANVQPVSNPAELTAATWSTAFPSPPTVMDNPDDMPTDTDIDAQGDVLEHVQAQQALVSDNHPVPQDSSFLAGFRTLQVWAEASYQQLELAFSSGMALWSAHTSELRVIGKNVVGFAVLSLIGLVFSSVFTLAAAIPQLALALFEAFDPKARAKIKLMLLLVLGFAVYYVHATSTFWLLAIAASTFYYWTGHPVSPSA